MQLAGALGIAILGTLAASRTDALAGDGVARLSALTGGYHLGVRDRRRAPSPSAS